MSRIFKERYKSSEKFKWLMKYWGIRREGTSMILITVKLTMRINIVKNRPTKIHRIQIEIISQALNGTGLLPIN